MLSISYATETGCGENIRRVLLNSRFLAVSFFLAIAHQLPAAPLDLAAAESVGMSSEKLDALKSRLQEELDEQVTGGMQVLVARRGKVVFYENLGHANIEARRPVTDETLFRVFSMTKPVVGAAMMMLYEEGRFSMTDPLSMHIPEFADLKVFAGTDESGELILEEPVREPTVQDLMLHTAGLTYGIFGNTAVDQLYMERGIGEFGQPLDQFIDRLAGIPLLYQPGTRWVYSVAVDVQGYLIQKWTGMEPGAYLRSRLFEPLGMDQTIAWVPAEKAGLLATVYTHDPEGQRVPFDGEMSTLHLQSGGGFSGGAQLISTADDYWRFAQMLLNGGEFEGERYLSPKTIDMMTADRLPSGVGIGTVGAGFGLNLGVITDPSRLPFPASEGEYYWSGLATTIFWIDPEEDLVAILLTQYLPFNGPYFRDLMHRLVYAAITEPN